MHAWPALFGVLTILVASAALAQEPKTAEDKFPLGKAAAELAPAGRAGLARVLTERFGTPGAPQAWAELPVDYGQAIDVARPAGWKFRAAHGNYQRHCAACHGVSGDGAGPKAAGLDPPPRDFRPGLFKWQSTVGNLAAGKARPLRHDLAETLLLGIPGTAMPAFAQLSAAERAELVEFVRWLAMRGEFAALVTPRFEDVTEPAEAQIVIDAGFAAELKTIVDAWKSADLETTMLRPKAKRPEPSADSLARGKALWSDKKVSCFRCHAPDGRPEPFPQIAGHPPSTVWDLSLAPLRGGAAPEDVFRRIRGGIVGSDMPAFPEAIISDEDVWHLVNYTLSLAPEKVRAKQVVRQQPK